MQGMGSRGSEATCRHTLVIRGFRVCVCGGIVGAYRTTAALFRHYSVWIPRDWNRDRGTGNREQGTGITYDIPIYSPYMVTLDGPQATRTIQPPLELFSLMGRVPVRRWARLRDDMGDADATPKTTPIGYGPGTHTHLITPPISAALSSTT